MLNGVQGDQKTAAAVPDLVLGTGICRNANQVLGRCKKSRPRTFELGGKHTRREYHLSFQLPHLAWLI